MLFKQVVLSDLANLAGWLRVTAAAISFPGGVEQLSHAEALATGKTLHLESIHIPIWLSAGWPPP